MAKITTLPDRVDCFSYAFSRKLVCRLSTKSISTWFKSEKTERAMEDAHDKGQVPTEFVIPEILIALQHLADQMKMPSVISDIYLLTDRARDLVKGSEDFLATLEKK